MTTSDHLSISASELGTLWMAYQNKTMNMRFLEYYIEKAEKQEAKRLLESYYNKESEHVKTLIKIFQDEGAALPIGFTEKDVTPGAPRLYDEMFDIMHLRLITEINMGLFTVHFSMAYRDDIRKLYQRFTADAQEAFDQTTGLLLEQSAIPRPPYVTMPKQVEFAKNKQYMTGFNLLTHKRTLNAVEIGHLYQAIEANTIGETLMTGFAQSAQNKEAAKIFFEAKDLAKKITSTLSDLLRQSDVHTPSPWAGTATDSTNAPFSDKMMMYQTSVFSSFGLTSNALGSAFSLRSDLPLKLAKIAQDTFSFAKNSGQVMIKNGWLEEPPQSEDRAKLSKGQTNK
ncbi:DUF3231 family protein [Halobacillus naozhouensis]|uniref:DUF3231 family protein n=1 Tax=Halobacillus naozhouensis TaxID=554880 RepID=A0ABY8J1C6_9BACI|nr:DUF3231 family protein [Halobacillus naozhouensis]WFT76304.1 DUF3231 family protein [Halobacillus naozhouensis]